MMAIAPSYDRAGEIDDDDALRPLWDTISTSTTSSAPPTSKSQRLLITLPTFGSGPFDVPSSVVRRPSSVVRRPFTQPEEPPTPSFRGHPRWRSSLHPPCVAQGRARS